MNRHRKQLLQKLDLRQRISTSNTDHLTIYRNFINKNHRLKTKRYKNKKVKDVDEIDPHFIDQLIKKGYNFD